MTYTPPKFRAGSFNCPRCNAYAHMIWEALLTPHGRQVDLSSALCNHCNVRTIWQVTAKNGAGSPIDAIMIVPRKVTAPQAHSDMPDDVREDFDEARSISGDSPRAACALLRLSVQKLCKHLGQPGKNINDDIGALVKAGMPQEVQRALDIVRVVGNNSVHPGELSASDVASVSDTLFTLVNLIVEDRIARPKRLEAIFASLPQGALDGIAKRDKLP